jgi:hypothetical protein
MPGTPRVLAALASPPATKALDPDPFPCRSLRHVVYAALLHFGLESAKPLKHAVLREQVSRNWAHFCDSVTDNFRVISPKNFRVMT